MPPSTRGAGPYPGTGVVGYHAYLPAYRLRRGEIAAAVGSSARGVRCVAGYDEDSTTLAVAAALPVVRGREPAAGSVWFATTDPVYADKTNATAVHAALDLQPGILAADLGPTARSAAPTSAREPTRRPPSCSASGIRWPASWVPPRSRPSSSTGGVRPGRRTARPGRNVSASSDTPSWPASCWLGSATLASSSAAS